MSTAAGKTTTAIDNNDNGKNGVLVPAKSAANAQSKSYGNNYKGFVAGVFSGIAKLSGELALSNNPHTVTCSNNL